MQGVVGFRRDGFQVEPVTPRTVSVGACGAFAPSRRLPETPAP